MSRQHSLDTISFLRVLRSRKGHVSNGVNSLRNYAFFESVVLSSGGNILPLRRINPPAGITLADAELMANNSAIPFCYRDGVAPHVDEIARMLMYMGHVPLSSAQHLLYGYYAHTHVLNACAIMMMHMKFPVQASRKEDGLYGLSNVHAEGSKANRRLAYIQEVRRSTLSQSQNIATVSNSTRPDKQTRKQGKTSCGNVGCTEDGVVRFGTLCICVKCSGMMNKPIKRAQYLKYDKMVLGSTGIVSTPRGTCAFRDLMDTSSSEFRAYMLGRCMATASRATREMVGSMVSTNPSLLFVMRVVQRLTRPQITALAKPNIVVANALIDAKTTKDALLRRRKNMPMPFVDARARVIAANIAGDTRESYDEWAQTSARMPQIPIRPHLCYGHQWGGWRHFMRANVDKDPAAIGRTEAAFNSYSSIMFNDAAGSGVIVVVSDSGVARTDISLSTTANVFSQYVYSDTAVVPGPYGTWPVPKTVFLLTMYNRQRYVICPRMATVTRAIRDGLLNIRFILDTSVTAVDGEHDPRYMPWRRSTDLGTALSPITIKHAQYITWGYLFEVLRMYYPAMAKGPVHVLLRGDPFAGICLVNELRVGSCWRTLVNHDRRANAGNGITVTGRRRGSVQDRDKIAMWLLAPLPAAVSTEDSNVLSTEMFLSGAFPIRVVPKECSGGAQKRCGMQTEGVPKRVRVDGDRACESQFMFPT